MTRFLEKEGFGAVSVASGEEGLVLARTLRPVAITPDVGLPGMKGWAVLTALKADAELANIPVIVVTTSHAPVSYDRRMGSALGAADYLTKPFDAARAVAAVRKHVRVPPSSVRVAEDARMKERLGWSCGVG